MTKRAHNSRYPEAIDYRGNSYAGPSEIYFAVSPKPAVRLDSFRNRLWKIFKRRNALSEEDINDALYLDARGYRAKYGVRKTWVNVENERVDVGQFFKENSDRAAVNYSTFRSRVVGSPPIDEVESGRLEDALTMRKADWHSFYGGGRYHEFVYEGGEYPELHGKRFHSMAAFLRVVGRYDDRANIWSRMKNGWSFEQALSIPISSPRQAEGRIYKVTRRSTGQVYIGLTTLTLEHRWALHLNSARTGAKNRFAKAILKDGAESFDLEVIEDGIDDDDLLKEREAHWIEYFEARGSKGLNTAPAGGLGTLRGRKVTYKDEEFTSLNEAGRILGGRLGLKPWIVRTRLVSGEPLPKNPRLHSDHPKAGSNLFRRWLALKRRHPGDVCEEWLDDYDAFELAVEPTQRKEFELVRIDDSRPWGPKNFKWVTTQEKVEQVHGKTVVIHGKHYPSIEAAAKAHGIGTSTLKYRIRAGGMTLEEAVDKPMSKKLQPKAVSIDGKTFTSANKAARYLSEVKGISFDQARYRIQKGDYS